MFIKLCGHVKSGQSQTFCMYMHCIAVCVCLFAVILTWHVCELKQNQWKKNSHTSDAVFSEQNPKLHPRSRIIIIIIIRDGKISKSHDTITWWFHNVIFIANFLFKTKMWKKAFSICYTMNFRLYIKCKKVAEIVLKHSYNAAVVCILILVCPSPFFPFLTCGT